jgi:hypothetical protein
MRSKKQESIMDHSETTITDILKDPLIRQMMRADRVSSRQMKKLLEDAARGQRIKQRCNPSPEIARHPPFPQRAQSAPDAGAPVSLQS